MPKFRDYEEVANTQDQDYLIVSRDMGGGTWITKKIKASKVPFSDVFTWTFNGLLKEGVEQDGFRIAELDGKIVKVVICCAARGSDGTAIFDINKHSPSTPITTQQNDIVGTTIFTTQENRPQIVGENNSEEEHAIYQTPSPDVLTFVEGDYFSIDIDSIGAGNGKDFAIQMFVQYNMI